MKGLLQVRPEAPGHSVLDANTLRQVLEYDGVLALEVIEPTAPRLREVLGVVDDRFADSVIRAALDPAGHHMMDDVQYV